MKNVNNEPNYTDYPPEIRRLLAIPGVNKEKALAWFNLGIDEPQTFNQALLLAEAVGYTSEQAKVVAAQWQMESAGGSRVGGNFNYFGIKSHNERTRNALIKRGINVSAADPTGTHEYVNGVKVKEKSSFMNFNNAFEAFAGHKVFLETNDRYKNALKATTAKDFALGLEKAGYATVPNYGSLLYSDYIKPKEDNPTSGDSRPKNWGAPVSSGKGESPQIFSNATYEEVGNIAPTIVPITPLPRLDQLPPTFLDTNIVEPKIQNITVPNFPISNFPTPSPIIGTPSTGRLPIINPQANGGILYAHGGNMNFKSPEAYKAWLAYGHASGEFAKTPGNQNITIKNKPHKVQHNMGGSLLMRYANGGQLTEFANGGSHEENPMGGIPLGMSNDGRQNLVEQNETKDNVKDYIFSERNKIDKKLAKEFNLPKSYIGKSFAEASKLANRVSSKRESDWDSIAANAIRRDLDKLITAQEVFKKREEAKDLEMMMQKHPDLMNSLMSQGAPQSIAPTMDPSQMPIDPQAMNAMTSPSAMPTSAVPMGEGGSEEGNSGQKANWAMAGMQMASAIPDIVAAANAETPKASRLPVGYGNPSGNPYGFSYGNPYGNQMGMPYGNQMNTPYGVRMYEWGGGVDKDNVDSINAWGTGLTAAGAALTAVNPIIGGAVSLIGTGVKSYGKAGEKNIAEQDKTALEKQLNPNVTTSGTPVNTVPNLDTQALYNPQMQSVYNTTNPAYLTNPYQQAAYGGKLFAMGDFLGDPPPTGTTEPPPTPSLGERWTSFTDPNKLYWDGYKGKKVPFPELSSTFQHLYADEGGFGITLNPETNNYNITEAPIKRWRDVDPNASTVDLQTTQTNDHTGAYGATGEPGAGTVTTQGGKFAHVKGEDGKLIRIPVYGKGWTSAVVGEGTPYISVGSDWNMIAPTTGGTPGAYAYGGNLYAGGGYRRMDNGGAGARIDTNLEDNTRTIDLRNSVGQDIANLAGLGYNLYQGLSPIDQVSANELYDVVPAQDFDFTESINTAKQLGAANLQYLKNSGAHPSNFLANYQNTLAAIADIQQKEETVDKSAQWEADKINAAAKAAATWQALQTNWGMKTSKQEHIKAALDSIQRRKQTEQQNLVDLTAGILANPDAAKQNEMLIGQRNYLSNFGDFMKQLKEKRETKKNLKKNKTEE